MSVDSTRVRWFMLARSLLRFFILPGVFVPPPTQTHPNPAAPEMRASTAQVNMIMSTMLASVAEGMCLSDSLGLNNEALIEVIWRGQR